ncbi:MAG TPA: hypothetical protein DCR93_04450 [Cytophagales bacterium]|nr:hypothetical protein [Cytophagales bacterium]
MQQVPGQKERLDRCLVRVKTQEFTGSEVTSESLRYQRFTKGDLGEINDFVQSRCTFSRVRGPQNGLKFQMKRTALILCSFHVEGSLPITHPTGSKFTSESTQAQDHSSSMARTHGNVNQMETLPGRSLSHTPPIVLKIPQNM